MYRRALDLRSHYYERHPNSTDAKGELAFVLERLVSVLNRLGQWEECAKLTSQRVTLRRSALESLKSDLARQRFIKALGSDSWYRLFARDFQGAHDSALEALELDADLLWVRMNMAHALLFLDRYAEAEALYRKYAEVDQNGKSTGQICREDFNALRKAGVEHPRMVDIEKLLPEPIEETESPVEAPSEEEPAKQDEKLLAPATTRSVHFRWVYEKDSLGRKIRSESVDLTGNLTPDQYGIVGYTSRFDPSNKEIERRFYGEDRRPMTLPRGYALWRASYSGEGQMSEKSYFKIDGSPASVDDGYSRIGYEYEGPQLISQTYIYDLAPHENGYRQERWLVDKPDRPIQKDYLDASGDPMPNHLGIATIKFERDAAGRITRRNFFDVVGQPTLSSEAIHGWVSEWDERGNEVLIRYFDTENQPTKLKEYNYVYWIAKYDDENRMVEKAYFDDADQPIEYMEDYTRIQHEFDEFGREIERRHYYDRQPHPDGYTSQVVTYDQQNRPVTLELFDAEGKPVIGSRGYSGWKQVFNNGGDIRETTYLLPDGSLASLSDGYSRIRQTFDDQDQVRSWTYFYDIKPHALGHLVEHWTLDDKKLAREIDYLDEAELPMVNSWGIAKQKFQRNQRGLIIQRKFYDTAGELMLDKDQVAGWTSKYDQDGHEVQRRYFDLNEEPTEGSLGHARTDMAYDEAGALRQRQYFDAEDQLLTMEVHITLVEPNSQGERLQLQIGDILLSYDDKPVLDTVGFIHSRKSESPEDAPRQLIVRRGEEELNVDVVPGPLGIGLDDRAPGK